jgi:Cd2+/Zn2+-exporting ATPase
LQKVFRFLRDPQAALTVACGLALAASLISLLFDAREFHLVAAYAAVLFGIPHALKMGLESLRNRELDVNVLMVIAAIGALALGYPADAGVLLFLFALSGLLEAIAVAKTKSAIDGLIQLRPDTALVITPEGDVSMPVAEIKPGDLVRILPFQAVPVDAEVLEGQGDVDESAISGESLPVNKSAGDPVLSGTQNLGSTLVVRVTRPSGETTLDKIVELVEEAQNNRASGEKISVWFGSRYTIFVLAAFGLSLIIRLALGQQFASASYEAVVLLVALSPCALVISTPASTLSAMTWCARNGILVRGGIYLEDSSKINAIIFDKTGTITTGKPEVTEVCVCEPAKVHSVVGCAEDSECWHGTGPLSEDAAYFLIHAAAVEKFSTHPIAKAIVRAAEDYKLVVPEAQDHRAVQAKGVIGTVNGEQVKVGHVRFFDQDDTFRSDFLDHVRRMQSRAQTVSVVQVGDRLAAIGIRDRVRPEASQAIELLKRLGVKKIVMATGDTPETAKAVASQVGIEEVHAGLLPKQKTEILRDLQKRGYRVMMVGDGINDAPTLVQANVGVAMGGLGSDIALNAADIVLMNDRLKAIPEIVKLGRRTAGIIKANLFFSSGIILALTVGSFITRLPLPLAVVGHEGSTFLVILNGLRLLKGPGRIG